MLNPIRSAFLLRSSNLEESPPRSLAEPVGCRPCIVDALEPTPRRSGATFPSRGGGVPSATSGRQHPKLPVDPLLERDLQSARIRASLPRPPAAPPSRSLIGSNKVMAGDPALLSASITDPVRVQKFETESKIVAAGEKYLGTPYVWGGSDPNGAGLDCSGFTYNAMKDAGASVPLEWFRRQVDPRTDPSGAEGYGMSVVKDPRPGDVVVFGTSHIGIYTGNVDGKPMYISANHGGPWASPGNSGDGRVDVMPVFSHPVQPPVYFRYTPPRE